MSGYGDVGYTSASIASGGAGGTISGRVFDNLNQQIQFHMFDVKASYSGPIGATVEANFGDDASIINSYPKSVYAPNSDVDLTQAYVSFTSGAFTGIIGKFETLAGAEVIESPSDYNFSRSILFGYAVPFTHTGGRLTWAATPQLSIIAGLNNGWDTTYQHNPTGIVNPITGAVYNDTSSLTFEGGAAWNPSKYFSWTLQGYDGQVQEGLAVATPGIFVISPARPVRSLIDTVVTWHATPAWTFVLNGDAGQQTNSNYFNNVGALAGYGTDTWSGVAGYANYAINSQWSVTGRLEYLADYGGARTGLTQRWGEGTLTLQYQPNSNVIVRLEGRGDLSNQNYFVGPNFNLYHQNAQFGVEGIVKWP